MNAADAANLEKKRLAAARYKEKAHEYYLAHKEEFKARERVRYEKNRDRCNQYSKMWYEEHKNDPDVKQRMLKNCKNYRERNREKYLESARIYRQKKREENEQKKPKEEVKLTYVDTVPEGTIIYGGPITLGQDAWA
jgi:hypothetical protein